MEEQVWPLLAMVCIAVMLLILPHCCLFLSSADLPGWHPPRKWVSAAVWPADSERCAGALQLIMCQEDKQKLEDEHLRIVSEADQLRQENALLRRELDECQRQMRAAGMEVGRSTALCWASDSIIQMLSAPCSQTKLLLSSRVITADSQQSSCQVHGHGRGCPLA